MRTLGPAGRRAWIESMSTYLRDAEYLVYYDGALIDICNADSLKLATRVCAGGADENRPSPASAASRIIRLCC